MHLLLDFSLMVMNPLIKPAGVILGFSVFLSFSMADRLKPGLFHFTTARPGTSIPALFSAFQLRRPCY
jgi:hypothetical protein